LYENLAKQFCGSVFLANESSSPIAPNTACTRRWGVWRHPIPHTNNVEDVHGYPDTLDEMRITAVRCPSCNRVTVTIESGKFHSKGSGHYVFESNSEHVVWPLQYVRPIPSEVPEHIAIDYHEAAAVLNLSPKASAALSRCCLQSILREAGGANQKNLVDQIAHATKNLPGYITKNIDAIRNIGNFAAHPTKDSASGELVEVEPGKAEWNLDVLDMLFDFYYVQPSLAQKRRDELNAKLQNAGKQPMK
jgi:hypothetical protein